MQKNFQHTRKEKDAVEENLGQTTAGRAIKKNWPEEKIDQHRLRSKASPDIA